MYKKRKEGKTKGLKKGRGALAAPP